MEFKMTSYIDRNVFDTLKESTGGDFIGELVDTFLADAPDLLAQLKSALASGSVDEFRRAAHSMKSNAATFGAMQLSALAKELEMMARANDLNIGGKLDVLIDEYQKAAAELKSMC
jgi:HPt (histidine-containing phosphotransfer) domain-containing protein